MEFFQLEWNPLSLSILMFLCSWAPHAMSWEARKECGVSGRRTHHHQDDLLNYLGECSLLKLEALTHVIWDSYHFLLPTWLAESEHFSTSPTEDGTDLAQTKNTEGAENEYMNKSFPFLYSFKVPMLVGKNLVQCKCFSGICTVQVA